jgi:mRNA interferase RelE/StbE
LTNQYKVAWQPKALKSLRRIDGTDRERLIRAAQALSFDPFPAASRKIVSPDDIYRIRVGSYRLLYTVENGRLLVLVLSVGHRRNIYRGLGG